MKVALYYHPWDPKNSDPLTFAEMDILPVAGQAIRYTNLEDHHEDGIVREIRWDLTNEDASFAIVVVEPT